MRAVVLTAPGECSVREVPAPVAAPGEVVLGALVEPGGNALRAAQAAGVGAGDRALVLGPGTIGLLVAMFAQAAGAEVHLMGLTPDSLAFARSLGFARTWTEQTLPDLP